MPRSDFSMLKFLMPENCTKNWLKNNCLDFIAKEMWHLNSLELHPLEYYAWETVWDLSQMLQVSCKFSEQLKACVVAKGGYF